jgi:4-amino-4-deoxychorismate lyase
MYWYVGQQIAGNSIELEIDTPALLYGATVFTTLRADRIISDYALHRDRLQISIERFGWQVPDWNSIECGIEFLAGVFPVLRITLFPDGRELITGRNLPLQLESWQREGVAVTIADRELARSLPLDKTGNYLAPWLALKQARDRQFTEAILTNDRGDWLETTTGNLWGDRAGNWYTPPLSAGILPGIIRSQFIAALRQQGDRAIEIPWNLDTIESLKSIGYSNSVVGFIPIHTVVTRMGTLRYAVDPDCRDEFMRNVNW